MRKKISKFTIKIQNQKIVPLWVLANDQVIFNAALNKKHDWKNRSRKISNLMRIAVFLKIPGVVIFLVGFYKLLASWNKVRNSQLKTKSSTEEYRKIFVGHGAKAEEFIFDDYRKNISESILRINVITLDGLEKIGTPHLFLLIKLLFQNSFGLSHNIKKLSRHFNLNMLDFLTVAALNIGEYVFFKAFFGIAKCKGVTEITFLALHVSAHSCIHADIRTVYLSHGLMKISIIMIKPDRIFVITPEERKYIDYVFNNNVNAKLVKNYQRIIDEKSNTILVISPESFIESSEEVKLNFDSLLKFAKSINFEIILRPSPKITPSDLLNLRNKISDFDSIDDLYLDLEKKLLTLRPKFVVALNSTGLFTALSLGIIPINFFTPDSDISINNVIYPMAIRALFWPRDQAIIKEAIYSDAIYAEHLDKLKNSIDTELPTKY